MSRLQFKRSVASFTVDRAYLRQQAREAAKAFVAPLAGVYAAINASSTQPRD